MPSALSQPLGGAFRHEALLYAGLDGFVEGTIGFIREGLASDEPVMCAVCPERIARLRAELGDEAERVRFVDMTVAGTNPGRIIPIWRDFVEEHAGDPLRHLRGIGEPLWAGRSDAEVLECQLHEALLNLAFRDAPRFTLLCPYDANGLSNDVIASVCLSHPLLVEDGTTRPSDAYLGLDVRDRFGASLPEPDTTPRELRFAIDDLSALRRTVSDYARAAGMPAARRHDLVLAVNELATNSIRHGGGHGRLRMWNENGSVVCEVSDAGSITEPLVGRQRPRTGQIGGYGLWLANQLCELVQLRSHEQGSVVRVHMHAKAR
jgi:anti-sigma regulatory factor (Ser/Thr protein kinase)